jgi:hypothetical protein
MPGQVVPRLGAPSFSCPHCGAVALQTWFHLYLSPADKDHPPSVFELQHLLALDVSRLSEDRQKLVEGLKARFAKNEITYDVQEYSRIVDLYC